jgi:hypothetical protein
MEVAELGAIGPLLQLRPVAGLQKVAGFLEKGHAKANGYYERPASPRSDLELAMALKRPTGDALAEALRERIGYTFRDQHLLQTALTHSSAVKATTNNERLEFLGDRVLGLVVAELLFRLFPDAREG